MMYAKDDIRSPLQVTAPRATADPSTPISRAQLIEFHAYTDHPDDYPVER
ncbi:hypothetical protein GCM10010915_26570 [Microbacterium faecale]|uniref:Uncharacterized protein n=1 Tax=Microbacterium faecale TaxID=1804630 RepID=A0A917DJ68_9MICO|nr:hypothetical protein [Microbacterium faecale]GGD44094.1 hypothetical protein GCM10010915_26570 [Microbacterium faecale]